LIFPGVGAFETAIANLTSKGLLEPLRAYVKSGKPYFGICIGMQVLFASSEESPSPGLGIIPTPISQFDASDKKAIPHMGWNSVEFLSTEQTDRQTEEREMGLREDETYYFVHSYRAAYDDATASEWAHTVAQYGNELFLASVRKGNVFATQFHPEKSGEAGLAVLRAWLEAPIKAIDSHHALRSSTMPTKREPKAKDGFTKRIIACLDVRTNDAGDLVVTKGDQYDVRETATTGAVRNLGKPVALAHRYFTSGADEICLLNITSFRNSPLCDQPMLEVVREAASKVFVPLTIGGGIKDTVDPDGTPRSALEVASAYFRAGADKVSIGSEAVYAVEKLLAHGQGDGTSPMETISAVYGRQAVVVSIDPRRFYVDPATCDTGPHADETIKGSEALAASEEERDKAWWYQCTVKGGREDWPVSVVQLARGAEALGAGEVLLNSIDRDGTSRGYDLDLIMLVRRAVGIPVVASSGAGKAADFTHVFAQTGVEAALAAGMFHRGEVEISSVKEECRRGGVAVREQHL
jgi:imidazole glycerol-phosphate synthase